MRGQGRSGRASEEKHFRRVSWFKAVARQRTEKRSFHSGLCLLRLSSVLLNRAFLRSQLVRGVRAAPLLSAGYELPRCGMDMSRKIRGKLYRPY